MPGSLAEAVGVAILAVVMIIFAGVACYLGAGLFQARTLIRREFFGYFLSPIAYVVLVVFLAVTGYLFTLTMQQLTASGPRGVEFPLQYMIGEQWLFWLVFLIIPPLLTMRLFAEERGSGTLELLMTAPVRDWQLVLAKYAACYAFYVVLWLPTLVYVPLLVNAGEPAFQMVWTTWSMTFLAGLLLLLAGGLLAFLPGGTDVRLTALVLLIAGIAAAGVGGWCHFREDPIHLVDWPVYLASGPMPVVSTYLGLALAGAMLLAIGLLISSLVRSQLVAALVSLALGLAFIVTGFWRPDLDPSTGFGRALYFVSVPQHFHDDFCRGLIDSRHLTLYLSVTVFSLFLTVRSLESRRWR
jgi:ABC-type transport system involved in multi-copper enzyme maturation permease subunit